MRWRDLQQVKRTKIICTIGPASNRDEVLRDLMKAGMNIARLNFSHNPDYTQTTQLITRIRTISRELGISVGIFIDLGGPKIRTRAVRGGAIELKAGATILITHEDIVGDESQISCNLECLVHDAQVGDPILLDDGLIGLKVISKIGNQKIRAEVINGGILKDRKGMNLPFTKLSIPVLTEKDHRDIEFGITQDIDAFALSFARHPSDIIELRRALKGSDKMIITKVEKPEAVQNILKIIKLSDAIMIARGDMAVEIGNEKVPVVQKNIIRLCNRFGRPVITATQMLETMVTNYTPTRAEVSDVANSIFDGTSAVMLSAETAVGKYPVRTVEMMVSVIREAESEPHIYYPKLEDSSLSLGASVIDAGIKAACTVNAKAIVCLTHTGATASLMARHRPQIPIIAITDQEKVLSRLSIVWGIEGIYLPDIITDADEMFHKTKEIVTKTYGLKKGDKIVICCGLPASRKVKVNTMKISEV